MKTFTYTRQVGPSYYSAQSDEEFCDKESFDYSVSDEEIKDAIIEILFNDFFSEVLKPLNNEQICIDIKKQIGEMVDYLNIDGKIEKFYEDELKDVFEEDAMNYINCN